jgi:hypothetical protein
MGQGFYTAIIYGSVLTEDQSESFWNLQEENEKFNKHCSKFKTVRTSYECEPPYIGVEIANTDEMLAQMRKTVALSGVLDFENITDHIGAKRISSAIEVFTQFRIGCDKFGFELPSPKLWLVNDYH